MEEPIINPVSSASSPTTSTGEWMLKEQTMQVLHARVARLKENWHVELEQWQSLRLEDLEAVYF